MLCFCKPNRFGYKEHKNGRMEAMMSVKECTIGLKACINAFKEEAKHVKEHKNALKEAMMSDKECTIGLKECINAVKGEARYVKEHKNGLKEAVVGLKELIRLRL